MSTHTLIKHFDHELKLGKAKANASLGGVLYKGAKAGDKTLLIFWAKTQMGFREQPQSHEHSGPGGTAIPVAQVAVEATDEDSMRAYLAMLNQPKE
jgi:hypothetical protein